MNNVKYIYLLMAIMCLFPGKILAEEEDFTLDNEGGDFTLEEEAPGKEKPGVYYSEWEAGFIYSSEDSFKFGEYNGLEEEGFKANLNFLIRRFSPYDDDSTTYTTAYGTNLGLSSRSLFAEHGDQGKYSVYFEFDQLQHYRLDDARTPFVGAGSANQSLPAGWVPAATTAGMTNLISSSRQVDVETERKKLGGGFSWIPAENWQLSANYHHEFKEGTETMAAIFGTNGGNMRSSTLIVPVDYNFDDFDLGISYANSKAQFELSYHLSLFDNNDEAVTWRNPFTGGGGASANDPGQIGLEPDNRAHQVTVAGGYNLGRTSRISANLSYGQMLQDDDFLPFGINPAFPVTTPLPSSDLDGKIETIYGNLNFTTRPFRNLGLGAHYTFDDRDNETPRDVFSRIANDSGAQANPAIPSANNRVPRPNSLERHNLELDADYRLSRKARLSMGYEFELKDRDDFTEVNITREHTGKVKLSTTPFSMASGWVEYAYAERNGTNYVSNRPLIEGHTADFIATLTPATGLFENDPLLRKSYLADRKQNSISGAANILPHDLVTVGLSGGYTDDNYNETILGLTDGERIHTTLDIGFLPRENIDAYTFLTYEHIEHDQRGFARNTDVFPGVVRDPDRFWRVDTEDRVYTIGAGIEWRQFLRKFDVKADYTFSKAITEIDPRGAGTPPAPLDFAPLPDLVTSIHTFTLQGDYKVKERLHLRLNYLFEYFKTNDFALDNVTQNTLGNVITLGNRSPDHTAHVVGLSMIYEF